jgi:cytochrome c
MKIKVAAAALLCLAVAALFIIVQAQAALRPLQGSSPSSDAESRSVWDGVYTGEQAERGHSLYHDKCETCHGASLAGESEAPPLAGAQFLSNWNGLTVGDLFERIRKSMPLNDPGSLTGQQNAGILAYLFNFNQFPAGKTELPNNAELLKQIRIEANRPDPKADRHDDK